MNHYSLQKSLPVPLSPNFICLVPAPRDQNDQETIDRIDLWMKRCAEMMLEKKKVSFLNKIRNIFTR